MRLTALATLVLLAVSQLVLTSTAQAQDKEITALVHKLESSDINEKTTAARLLGEIGPASVYAIPPLIKLHDAADPGLRYEVVVALGRINSHAKQVVPVLRHLLTDDVAAIKLSAIEALRGFGSHANDAVPDLVKLLDHHEPLIAVMSARAIAEIQTGKPVEGARIKSVLLSGLKNERGEVSGEAIHGLTVLGPDVVPSIRELLNNSTLGARVQACNALAALGPASVSAVDDLVTAAKAPEADLRWHAISALGEIGPDAKAAVPVLIAALEDANEHVKMSAENALQRIGKAAVPALVESLKKESLQQQVLPIIAEIGPDAASAVPALSTLLAAKNLETKREVILALAGIGDAAKSTSGELVKLLNDQQFQFRAAAAYALGKIKANEAVPTLRDALQTSKDSRLQLAAVWSLLQFDPQNEEYVKLAIPRLTAAIEDEKAEIRREAIKSLGRMGSRAKGSVPALKKGLGDKDLIVRQETLVALAQIGPDSVSLVPEIIPALDDDHPPIRSVAIYALGKIGTAAKSAVPQLHRFLYSRNPHEKTMAAWALLNITPDPETLKSTVPVIIKALGRSENPEARVEFARMLGKFGATFPEAKEALKAALKDPDENVRKSAERALSELK